MKKTMKAAFVVAVAAVIGYGVYENKNIIFTDDIK